MSGQRFLGLEKLTLNNLVQDSSNVHELLAYEAFRAAGVPAPRTGYAYVRVNGQDYGLYLNVETPDAVSLPRWFDSTRHLYEGAYGSDVSVGGAGAFEVDEGSDTERGDLEALIAAANGEDPDWAGRMGSVADLREMTRMWAVEKYIGDWDSYSGRKDSLHPNNYFLHSDAAGRFAMLPWGTDQTWDQHIVFDAPASLMFNKCLADASCAASYLEAVRDVRTVVAGLDLDSQAQATAASLASWQQLDPRREYSLEEIQAGVSATRAFLADRPAEAAEWLDSAAPVDPLSVDPPSVVAAAPALAAPGGAALQPPPVTPVPTVSVGRPKAAFGVITTPVGLPGAGRLTQRATIALGRHIRTVCKAAARRAGPGAVTLRCRLSSAARRRLRARSLKVTLHTYFTPLRGRPTALSHRVMLPRA